MFRLTNPYISSVQSSIHFGRIFPIPICLQIGEKGSILFNTPPINQKLRIKLPDWSKNETLKAEAVDFNDPFYRNGDNLIDDKWPCRLKGSNTPKFNQSELDTHFIGQSEPKKTPPVKRSVDTKPNHVKLKHESKVPRITKVTNPKKAIE